MSTTRPAQAVARSVAVLVTALLMWGGFVPPAYAAACEGTAGVTVVADFTALGGDVQVRCAPGDPDSGLAALTGAGFSYTFASRQPGFVCRIDGQPTADKDKCVNTSPADASWGYWHAARGGRWQYSNEGAGTYDPPPGSVEGWAFGAKDEPRTAPPAAAPSPSAAAPSPSARPRTTVATTPRPASSAAPTTARPTSAASGSAPTVGVPAAATPSATPSPSPDPAVTALATDVARPKPVTTGQGRGGLSLLLAAAVIAVLVGSTIVTVRRRGREGE